MTAGSTGAWQPRGSRAGRFGRLPVFLSVQSHCQSGPAGAAQSRRLLVCRRLTRRLPERFRVTSHRPACLPGLSFFNLSWAPFIMYAGSALPGHAVIMDANADESRLVERSLAGDAPAFTRLLYLHRSELLSYLERHIPETSRRLLDPQDLLQDVHFEAFRRLQQYHSDPADPNAFLRWLMTIARHRLIDVLRQHNRLKRGGGLGDDQEVMGLLRQWGLYLRTPSQSAAAHERLLALEKALDALPQDQLQAVRLRYVEGLGAREAADRMNRSERSVQMLCHRALQNLRSQLQSTASD